MTRQEHSLKQLETVIKSVNAHFKTRKTLKMSEWTMIFYRDCSDYTFYNFLEADESKQSKKQR